jgi:hypothetical protein
MILTTLFAVATAVAVAPRPTIQLTRADCRGICERVITRNFADDYQTTDLRKIVPGPLQGALGCFCQFKATPKEGGADICAQLSSNIYTPAAYGYKTIKCP